MNKSCMAPLFDRPANALIAWLSEPIQGIEGEVSAQQFLQHVESLSKALPEAKHAINLCDNRYVFLVALCAVILRQQTNLLPSNKNTETQKRLAARYSSTYLIHDGELALSSDITTFNVHDVVLQTANNNSGVPNVSLDHLSVISFTSGSTGEAKPNLKTWRTLRESTAINSRYMLPNDHQVFSHLATVPGQHMWGLETSVLMSLFANMCLIDARPLYPRDIVNLLTRIPQPASLVSTPLHLRSLVALEGPLPAIDNVLVATAPLAQELAQAIEEKFDTELREVYGCSEVGSMAVRRAAQTDVWTQFLGLNYVQNDLGETSVSADHLPDTVILEDRLEKVDENSFRLQGRATDQIKIAGKRGSLAEVNKVLMTYPSLLDGVVFFPPQDRPVPRLVAMVVLGQESSEKRSAKDDLRAHFKKYLDSAFIPRPIILVDSLPREDSGKLIKTKLLEFYQATKSKL